MCGSRRLFCDRYEILRILGRGGFGITFLAKNVALPGNPLCVIKQLCPRTTSVKTWQRASQRFKKEAKTLATLGSHAQIPMLLDYFESSGEFYLIQEYIPGNTLAREVRRNGRKTETEVKQFLQELLPVLQYVHDHQVIHRDIKPQNILRCEDDRRIVLIDFGAVKEKLAAPHDNSMNRSVSTNFIGTNGFAPPEQLSLRPVYATDIYALGITCLYLLTGKGPLEFGYDPHTGEISWQNQVEISDEFAQILAKMVKIPVSERFRTAHDLVIALTGKKSPQNLTQNLTSYLTHQKPADPNSSLSGQNSAYISPISRAATAIRQLKAKLSKRKSNQDFQPK
jgi:serine/threonine-protein kinase